MIMRITTIVLVSACLSSVLGPNEAINRGSIKDLFETISNGVKESGDVSLLNFYDEALMDIVPYLFGQKPSNADGKFEQYRDYAMKDTSNDDIALADIGEIVLRSGYEVETHKIVAEDDYITTLYRLINPLADKSKLKHPPIMMLHGGLIDPTAYVDTSSIQHHPEKYPRSPADGPITSWNRSLGFTLSNNGYDVWLVGTRGSNKDSSGRLPTHGVKRFFKENKNRTLTDRLMKLYGSKMYWRYSFDEIISKEIPYQIDKVLEVTKSDNVSLFAYSYGTTIALSMLGSEPDVARNIHNAVIMAPFVSYKDSGAAIKSLCQLIMVTNEELGTWIFTQPMRFKVSRRLLPLLSKIKRYRYTFIKLYLNLLSGSSGKYRTLLEPTVLGHLNQPLSFMQLKHACQMARMRQYQKYDYGFIVNKFVYDQLKPPIYDVSNIHVKNWLLIQGENDNFGNNASVQQVLKMVNPKPEHLLIKGYSHYDLIAGMDVDKRVVLPVLEFYDRFVLPPRHSNRTQS